MKKVYKESIDSKLKSTWQIIGRMYFAEAAKHGATLAGSYFLMNINSKDGSYASDVAPKMGMESSSLSRMIKTLEDAGLITRIADKQDKRKVKIILTQKGLDKKESAKSIVRNFNTHIEEKIGKERKDTLMEILGEIADLAEERLKELKQA
jgi:DNA-binding MarR family transcriptional regulator